MPARKENSPPSCAATTTLRTVTTSAFSSARAVAVGVRTHQPAGAQQHPAEVTGDHHDQIRQAAVLQHLQCRGPGRFGRLAIVGVAFPIPSRSR